MGRRLRIRMCMGRRSLFVMGRRGVLVCLGIRVARWGVRARSWGRWECWSVWDRSMEDVDGVIMRRSKEKGKNHEMDRRGKQE